jgi:membrane protein YdbS with pleckstrin-like domain
LHDSPCLNTEKRITRPKGIGTSADSACCSPKLAPSLCYLAFQRPNAAHVYLRETKMSEETDVWFGTQSQVVNLGVFFLFGFFFWLVFPLLIILWKWLEVKNTKYELTTQRLRTRYGILNKKTDELELYRVRDYKLDQPLFLRLFSLSSVILTTSDKSNPQVVIRAIPNGEDLREQIRTYVEECRTRKGVREVDFE